ISELRDQISEAGHAAIRHLVGDLERYMELGREMPTGELLYQFIRDSGWLIRLYREETARDVAEAKNITKFFDRVQAAARTLRYDNVREFVKHLDALIDAGEDPAVAEADVETPAVRVLTVHKAKGLEFPVVFLVNLVQEKFPSRRRRGRSRRAPSRRSSTSPPRRKPWRRCWSRWRRTRRSRSATSRSTITRPVRSSTSTSTSSASRSVAITPWPTAPSSTRLSSTT